MTDTTQTPAPIVDETATLRATLAALQVDNARLHSEQQTNATALAAAIRDRDALTTKVTALEPKATLADDLQVKYDGLVNKGRESDLFAAVRAKASGPEPDVVLGYLGRLHDAGKINKFAADTAAEAAKALEAIAKDAPSLLQPSTPQPSGPSAVRPVTNPGRYPSPFHK